MTDRIGQGRASLRALLLAGVSDFPLRRKVPEPQTGLVQHVQPEPPGFRRYGDNTFAKEKVGTGASESGGSPNGRQREPKPTLVGPDRERAQVPRP